MKWGTMDISKYTAYFHDGSLIDIKNIDDTIEISLSSAEVDPEDLTDDIPLGEYDRINGILHLEGIKKITRNDLLFNGILKMERQSGEIHRFKIRDAVVELQIDWEDFKPKSQVNDFSTIIIEAEKIYWENKPDLVDPYW